MNEYAEVGSTVPRSKFRMETGIEVLADWAETARQSDLNAIYKALFAMLDGSLFRTYRIVDDFQRANELYVIVRDDLVLKIRINCFDSFGIVGIGPRDEFTKRHGGWYAP
jgi:Family of unknown function (DUF6235)